MPVRAHYRSKTKAQRFDIHALAILKELGIRLPVVQVAVPFRGALAVQPDLAYVAVVNGIIVGMPRAAVPTTVALQAYCGGLNHQCGSEEGVNDSPSA